MHPMTVAVYHSQSSLLSLLCLFTPPFHRTDRGYGFSAALPLNVAQGEHEAVQVNRESFHCLIMTIDYCFNKRNNTPAVPGRGIGRLFQSGPLRMFISELPFLFGSALRVQLNLKCSFHCVCLPPFVLLDSRFILYYRIVLERNVFVGLEFLKPCYYQGFLRRDGDFWVWNMVRWVDDRIKR